MKTDWFKKLVLLLPAITFLYLLRFKIGRLPANVFEVIIYLTAIFAFVYNPSWRKLTKKEVVVIGLIGVISLIGLIISNDKTTGLGIIKGWVIPGVLTYWMLSRAIKTDADTKFMLKGMVWQGLMVAFVAIVQTLPQVQIWWADNFEFTGQYFLTGRSVSIFNSPNSAAMILAPSIIIANATRSKGTWGWFILAVLALGLVDTMSRGGIIAILVGLAIYLLWKFQHKIWGNIPLIITILAFNPITLINIAERNPNDMDIRVHIWRASYNMIKEHAFWGNGLTNFQNQFSHFIAGQYNYDVIIGYAIQPHNIFLYTWFLFGLTGLLGLILGIGYLMYLSTKDNSLYAILGGVIVAMIVVQGMVDNTLWKNDLVIWFAVCVVLIMSSKRVDRIMRNTEQ